MSEIVTITEEDRIAAETLLETYLTNAFPDTDFTKGGAVRDLVIGALAYIYAYLQKERDYVRARQSLLTLGALTGTDVDDAVDEILSNWFVTRNTGRQSTGTATVFLSSSASILIPVTALFFKTPSLRFVINSKIDLAYDADDLTPVSDSSGAVVAYQLRVPLKSIDFGASYDIDPGPFVDFTKFSSNIIRVENANKFTGGTSTEDTTSMIERSATAVSVHDLNSARSIDVVLKDTFSSVDDVTVIGYGDEEMSRDLVLEEATGTRIHAGGHVDAYLRTPITESKTYSAVVGDMFTDPREGYYILRDDTIPNFKDLAVNVLAGDILIIYDYLPASESSMYIVNQVTKYGVFVSPRSPFPMELPTLDIDNTDHGDHDDGQVGPTYTATATNKIYSPTYTFTAADAGKWVRVKDSAIPNATLPSNTNNGTWVISAIDTVNNFATITMAAGETLVDETGTAWELLTRIVDYSIGINPPSYNNKVTRRISGQFTKTIQNDGRILMPGEPIYRVTDVSFASAVSVYAIDGRVTFPVRSNLEPTFVAPANPEDLEYELLCANPDQAPSGWQLMELDIGWAASKDLFNTETLRVTYDTLTGYDEVWAYMLSGDQRIECGSVIPKGLHPVYLHFTINYSQAKTATEELDVAEAQAGLAEFINDFDTREDLDSSDIMAYLRATFSVIGYIAPLTIYYDLIAPDGRVIYFKSVSKVTIEQANIIDPVTLVYPMPGAPEYLFEDPVGVGVSNSTVRYLTVADLLTFTKI